MPWIIGIDEAGYGPNLGPLVMTAVTLQVPDRFVGIDLWNELKKAVRRHPSGNDGRLLVDDSKLVYSTSRGLRDLEMGVLGALPSEFDCRETSLGPLIDRLCPRSREGLVREPWFLGTTNLPIEADSDEMTDLACQFEQVCGLSQVRVADVESVVICTPHFNQLLDRWGSKGAVLAHALMELFGRHSDPDGDQQPVHFYVDKHGGRNFYTAMLQNVVEGMVVAIEEGALRSSYEVRGWKRNVQITFQPRADSEHFCVALAAMVSKYLRELLMLEFNQFWQRKMPGLKPTAGYPGDASRFYEAIRPAAAQLGFSEDSLWRRK